MPDAPEEAVAAMLEERWACASPGKDEIYWPRGVYRAAQVAEAGKRVAVGCYPAHGAGRITAVARGLWVREDYVTVDVASIMEPDAGEAREACRAAVEEALRILATYPVPGYELVEAVETPLSAEDQTVARGTILVRCMRIVTKGGE